VQLISSLEQGELQQARALWQLLVPVVNAVFAEPNPAVIKAVLARQGLIQDGLRLPMIAAREGATERLLAAMKKLP
jgi:4-hydroxy-tetrahydrodipicolinate synthase